MTVSRTINITGFKPYYHQKKVIDLLCGEKQRGIGRTVVVNSSRQKGKTLMVSQILLFYACRYAKSKSIYVAPVLRQSRMVFDTLSKGLEGCPELVKAKNASELVIKLINGSEIRFLSCEQDDTLRGWSVSGILCCDELAFWPEDILPKILPWVDAHHANCLFTSTPLARSGWFYNYYLQGKNGENGVITIDWSDDEFKSSIEQILPPEKLLIYKEMLPSRVYRQEYLGEFLDEDSAVFGNFSKCIKDVAIKPNDKLYCGIDWSNQQGGDYTVLSIFNQDGNQVYLKRWNNLEVLSQINTLYNELSPLLSKIAVITCETNSLGLPLTSLLEQKSHLIGQKIKGFTTTNQSKADLVVQFQAALEGGKATLLPDENERLEFQSFSCTYNPRTHIATYQASSGHDDEVMATLFAWHSLKEAKATGNYSIRVSRNNNFKVI